MPNQKDSVPYDKLSLTLSFFAFVISTGWAAFTYFQLLPIYQANIVVSDSGIEVTTVFNEGTEIKMIPDAKPLISGLPSQTLEVYEPAESIIGRDVIRPSIQNVGRASARNLRFHVYAVFLNPKYKIIYDESRDVLEFYNEKVIGELAPDNSIVIGSLSIPFKARAAVDKEQVALLFRLEYADTVNRLVKQDKVLAFQYTVGTFLKNTNEKSLPQKDSAINTLIESDYKKIYRRLLKYAEERNDIGLLKWLEKNPVAQ